LRGGRAVPSLLTPVKTEPTNETSPHLYRFSSSPAPSMRYHTFPSELRSPSTSSFDNERHPPPYSNGVSNVSFPTPSSPSIPYNGGSNGNPLPSSYSDGGGGSYGSDDSGAFNGNQYTGTNRSSSHSFCACRSSHGLGIVYISLAQQLQSTLGALRQYSNHPPNTQCMLYRRIVELNNLMQYVFIILSV